MRAGVGHTLVACLATFASGALAWASHVGPVVYGDADGEENNPSCAFLDAGWAEVKVDNAPNGTHSDGTLEFTIENSDGSFFDWKSNIGVDAVVVKGGNRGSNVYFYDPEAKADGNLTSPLNTKDNVPQVSHVSACYDADAPQQSTTPQGGQNERSSGGEQQSGGEQEAAGDTPGSGEQEAGGDTTTGGELPGEEVAAERGEERRADGRQDARGRDPQPDEPAEDTLAAAEDGGGEGGPDAESDDPNAGNDVAGEADSDGGDADVEEETASSGTGEARERLPFSGAPAAAILATGLGLLAGGSALRRRRR